MIYLSLSFFLFLIKHNFKNSLIENFIILSNVDFFYLELQQIKIYYLMKNYSFNIFLYFKT